MMCAIVMYKMIFCDIRIRGGGEKEENYRARDAQQQ